MFCIECRWGFPWGQEWGKRMDKGGELTINCSARGIAPVSKIAQKHVMRDCSCRQEKGTGKGIGRAQILHSLEAIQVAVVCVE
jgi:hypothetical protein